MSSVETLRRVIRFGLQNYMRNGWLSIATTFVIAITLFIISVFILRSYSLRNDVQSIQNKLDMAIYINDKPAEEEVLAFVDQLKAYPEVKEVVYLNKTQVIEEWNKLYVDQKIKNQVNAENNPLPRTIKLKTHDPKDLEVIDKKIDALPFLTHIQSMSYRNNRNLIQQLDAQAKKVTRDGFIVGGIFIALAFVFIYNTIRLMIRLRQDEIAIMKLVGATDSFVRGPFLIESILYGLFAGLITLVALYFYLQSGFSDSSSIIATTSPNASPLFLLFQSYMTEIGAVLIGIGVVLTVFCSWISMQYHLKR